MDLAPAYPENSGIDAFLRRIELNREHGEVSVVDEWEVSRPDEIPLVWHLVLRERPVILAHDVIQLNDKIAVRVSGTEVQASVEPKPILDGNLRKIWGDELFRLRLSAKSAQPQGSFNLAFFRMKS